MPTSVEAYAADSPTADLKQTTISRRDIQPDDVEINVVGCGICHSDLHVVRNDWGGSSYPVVPGHEVIGQAVAVGDKVTNVKAGDYVAVGCLVDSCLDCPLCKQDVKTFCVKGSVQTYNGPDKYQTGPHTFGGYSKKIVVRDHFVLKVPKAFHSKEKLLAAAPLLCAGITTYSPLNRFKVGKGTKVGVIGLGGLGHMGVKLAKGLGAEVTVFSRSHKKDALAKELGADNVIASSSSDEMKSAANSLDIIIDCIPVSHEVDPYVPALKPFGNLVIVGQLGPLGDKAMNSVPLVFGNRGVIGSAIGGIAETQQMFDLCAEKDILPEIEVIKFKDINDAYKRLADGDVNGRIVIDVEDS